MPGEKDKAKKSRLAKYLPVLIVVVAVLYGTAAYFLLFMPRIGQLMAGGALDLRPFEARLSDYESYLNRITEEKDDFSLIHSAYLRKLPLILPDWADAPNLYVQMDAVARKSGLMLASIDTVPDAGPPGPHGLKRVRVSLSLMGGGYDEFEIFLANLERLVRVSDIESLTFSAGDTSYSVILTAYFIDPGATPAQATPTVPRLPDRF